MKVYVVSLYDRQKAWSFKVIFQHYPTYVEVLRRLPNELRIVLAGGSNEAKFSLGLGDVEFSSPLFSGNPNGPEFFDRSKVNSKTLIGRLTVERVRIHK